MKALFNSYQLNYSITLEPETVKEFGELLRVAKNANSEKPRIVMNFEDIPYCSITIWKRSRSVQKNYINPNTK